MTRSAIAVLLCAAGSHAQEARKVPQPPPPFEQLVKMRAVLKLPGMDRVKVRKDVIYKTTSDVTLLADVYMPPDAPAGGRLPAVVMIHGGPIPPGSGPKGMGVYQSLGELVAVSGMAAVTFNHRFHGAPMLVEAAGDVRDLVRHVRENAAGYGIDGERLALWAFSGGGPFLSSALREGPGYVKALAAYYAVMDLQQRPASVAPGSPNDLDDETRKAYSPAHHVATSPRPTAPILIARAGFDNPWINGSIDRFVQKALERNVSLELLNHANGRHGFDILDDDERSREILIRTLAFLKSRLLL